MRSFVTVTNTGNFSLAARQLRLTQSTVSKHIAALEKHLAVRLIRRTTRTFKLTDEGSSYFEAAQRALAALDEAECVIGTPGDAGGLLRVTMPLSLAETRVIKIIADFLTQFPNISFDLSLSDHALNLVADNIDVAIRVGRLVDSSLVVRKIGMARRVLVASPTYLDLAGRPRDPAELIRHNCVLYNLLSAGAHWSFTSGEDVIVTGNLSADSPHALRAAVRANIGIAASARWLFEKELASGELEIVLPDHQPLPMPIQAVLPSNRYTTSRTRMFIDFVSQALARDPLIALD